VLVAQKNERVRGRRDFDIVVAWAIVATHHCQILDYFNCLGVVEPPNHTIFAEFNFSCAGLYDELIGDSVVLQLRRPSLLGVAERSDEGRRSGAVHRQQHHAFTSETLERARRGLCSCDSRYTGVGDHSNVTDEPYQQQRMSSRLRQRLLQLAKIAPSTCSATGRQIGVETLLLAAIGSFLTKAQPSRKSWII
jgi:hypothetical protein